MSPSCNINLLFVTWILTGVNACLFISSIYCVTRLMRYECQKADNINSSRNNIHQQKSKTPKLLLYSGFAFFIISCILLLSWHYIIVSVCYSIEGVITRIIAIFFLYVIVQIYLLWIVMFMKLYYVFKNSAYELGKITIKMFVSLFVSLPILMIISILLFSAIPPKAMLIPLILFAIFSLLLSYLFISKLFQIYKDSVQLNNTNKMDTNNNILSTMTRTTILALISMIFSILVPIIEIIVYTKLGKNENWSELITFSFILMDIYTNFICVILSYSVFTNEYNKCCGYIDMKVKLFLFNMIPKDNNVVDIPDVSENGERANML